MINTLKTDQDKTLLFSVIIPTRNHARFVADLLDSLAFLDPINHRWEVLVIDNGSTDQTEDLVKGKISSLPIEIRYIYEPRLGLHNGRHRGALEASGKYLAYLDDDVLVSPTWFQGFDKLIAGQAEAVVGRILPKWETQPPAWLIKLIREPGYLSLLNLGTEGFFSEPQCVYGDTFFIPVQLVFDLGGFHPDSMPSNQLRYRGDGETGLMWKFKQAGFRAWYEPDATVYHRIPKDRMSFDYLCKREYAQGISDSFSEIRASQLDPAILSDLYLAPPETSRKTIQYYRGRINEFTAYQLILNLTNRVLRSIPMSQPNIKKRLRNAWWSGYRYHQNEVKIDPDLLQWVLQKDYLDSQL